VEEPRSALSELQGVSLVRDQLHRSLHTIQQEKKHLKRLLQDRTVVQKNAYWFAMLFRICVAVNTTYGKKLKKS
jgi:hypothetical protein